jgi:hypothetical protein
VVVKGLSRAQFVRRGAAAAGGAVAVGLLDPLAAFGRAAGSPNPIPGGFLLPGFDPVPSNPDIHILPPGLVGAPLDVSAITDFNGTVAAADIQGTAHGGDGTSYHFDADMRVMQGTYVDTDGKLKKGSFGFV